jgi:nucleotide-binding universal stress UspA family protein
VTPINTILVPTDFSHSSREALEYARGVATALNASLHLFHVVENPFVYGMYTEVYAALPTDYLDSLETTARTRLETLLTPEEKDQFRAEFITRVGIPAREILDYLAVHPEVGLVIMATAGRGGVARVVLGSVADKIVRGAPCPVMTVHPQHRGEGLEGTRAA